MTDAVFERIRRVLDARRLTCSEAARRCGVPAKTLTNWREGVRLPGPANLLRFARAFGVSLDWLYGLAPDSAPASSPPARGKVKQHWRTPGPRTGTLHVHVPDVGKVRVTVHRVLDGRALVSVEVPDGVSVTLPDQTPEENDR